MVLICRHLLIFDTCYQISPCQYTSRGSSRAPDEQRLYSQTTDTHIFSARKTTPAIANWSQPIPSLSTSPPHVPNGNIILQRCRNGAQWFTYTFVVPIYAPSGLPSSLRLFLMAGNVVGMFITEPHTDFEQNTAPATSIDV